MNLLNCIFALLLLCCTNTQVYAQDKPAPRKNQGGVIGALGIVEDAVSGGSKGKTSEEGEMPAGPTDEKWSDFVKRARSDMAADKQKQRRHIPAELPEEKEALRKAGLPESASLLDLPPEALKELYSDGKDGRIFKPQPELDNKPLPYATQERPYIASEPATQADSEPEAKKESEMNDEDKGEKSSETLKDAYKTAKGVQWGAKAGGFETISKGASGTADALKGARAIDEVTQGKRSGASKAAELAAKYGAGKASGILVKPVAGAVEATAEGMDKVNKTMDNPTEENIGETTKHVEEFQYEAAKNAGVDVKKIKEKVGGWKDWYYDKMYDFAPGWIPDKEKLKRDLRPQKIDPSVFEKPDDQ